MLIPGIHLRTISQEVFMNLIHNMCFGITLLKSLPLLTGVNEFKEISMQRMQLKIVKAHCIQYIISLAPKEMWQWF